MLTHILMYLIVGALIILMYIDELEFDRNMAYVTIPILVLLAPMCVVVAVVMGFVNFIVSVLRINMEK